MHSSRGDKTGKSAGQFQANVYTKKRGKLKIGEKISRRPRSKGRLPATRPCNVQRGRFFTQQTLKGKAAADLGGERAAHRRAGTAEIAEGARGEAQLFGVGGGREDRARGRIRADAGDVGGVIHRHGESPDVGDVVRARIIAIENVEKFDEGSRYEAFVERERTADAEIPLNVRSSR